MKIRTFILSVLMVLCSVFGVCTAFNADKIVSAVTSDASVWDGNSVTSKPSNFDFDFYAEDNTYYIYSAKGLAYFAYLVSSGDTMTNYTIYLETDIDLNNQAWTSIGTLSTDAGSAYYFGGTFDGQGHTIYNMYYSNNSATYVGLFGTLYGGVVRNLNVYANLTSTLSGSGYVAGIAAYASGGSKILNCTVHGTISGCHYVGGIVGAIMAETTDKAVTIANCANYATLTSGSGSTNYIGGIVGYVMNKNTVSECFNEGDIVIKTNSTFGAYGGIVGYSTGGTTSDYLTIENSYNVGDISTSSSLSSVSTSTYAGGVLGYSKATNNICYFRLVNVYNAGDITSGVSMYVAGLVGYAGAINGSVTVTVEEDGSTTSYTTSVYIENSFGVGTISGTTSSKVNQLFNGSSTSAAGSNVYYDKSISTSAANFGTGVTHLEGKVTTQDFMESDLGWSTDIWGVSASINNSLPYLLNTTNMNSANGDPATTLSSNLSGEGTASSPYLIYTAGDLAYVADYFNSTLISASADQIYFSLQNDINLSSKAWTPIGSTYTYSFKNAVFDGNNYTISGLNCSYQSNYTYVGLFGYAEHSVIKNVIVSDVRYIGTASTDCCVGTIVASLRNSYLINCADMNYDGVNSTTPSVGEYDSDAYIIYGENNEGEVKVNSDITIAVSGTGNTITYFDTIEVTTGNRYTMSYNDYSQKYSSWTNAEIIAKIVVDKKTDYTFTFTYTDANGNQFTVSSWDYIGVKQNVGLGTGDSDANEGYVAKVNANGGTIYDYGQVYSEIKIEVQESDAKITSFNGEKIDNGEDCYVSYKNYSSYTNAEIIAMIGVNNETSNGADYTFTFTFTDANGNNFTVTNWENISKQYGVHSGIGYIIVTETSSTTLSVIDITEYDATFLSSLPVDTTAETAHAVVKAGNKIISYVFTSNTDSEASINESETDIINTAEINLGVTYYNLVHYGITAQWEEVRDIEYTIYYNAYEEYMGYVTELKSETITITYNEYLTYEEFKNSITGALTVSRSNFSIKGIYTTFDDGTFDNELAENGLFCNTDTTFYIEWEGSSTENQTLTLKFFDGEDLTGNFSIQDAIASIKVTFNYSGVKSVTTELDGSDLINGGEYYYYTLNYATAWFDDITSGGYTAENVTIEILYNDGYKYATNALPGDVVTDLTEIYTTYFGSVSISDVASISKDDGNANYGTTYTLSHANGGITLTNSIIREIETFTLSVGEDVNFGLAFSGDDASISIIHNVSILQKDTSTGTISYNDSKYSFTLLLNWQSTFASSIDDGFYFGVNMFDNYVLASDGTSLGKFELDESHYTTYTSDTDKTMIIQITVNTNNYYYYMFEYTYNDDTKQNIQTLYKLNSKFDIVDTIASIYYNVESGTASALAAAQKEYTIDTYVNSPFMLIFSTDGTDQYFSSYNELGDSEYDGVFNQVINSTTNRKGSTDDYEPSKIVYDFSAVTNDNSYALLTKLAGSGLTISLTNTLAAINFHFVDENGDFVFTDENDNEVSSSYAPTIYQVVGSSSVKTTSITTNAASLVIDGSGSLSFYIKNSAYYQWNYRGSDSGDTLTQTGNSYYDQASGIDSVSSYTSSKSPSNMVIIVGEDIYTGDGEPNIYSQLITATIDYDTEKDTCKTDVTTKTSYGFTINFSNNFVAGEYDIYFVIEKVQYSYSIETRYSQTNSITLDSLYVDTGNDTSTYVYVGTEATIDNCSVDALNFYLYDTIMANSSNNVYLYNERSDSPGYAFGTYLVYYDDSYTMLGYNSSTYDNQDYYYRNFSPVDFVSNYFSYVELVGDVYTFTFYAVYISYSRSYSLISSGVMINNYYEKGYGSSCDYEYYYMAQNGILGLSIDGSAGQSGSYYYNSGTTEFPSSATDQNKLSGTTFTYSIKSNYQSSYRITGIKILPSVPSGSFSSGSEEISDMGNLVTSLDDTTATLSGTELEKIIREKISGGDASYECFYVIVVVEQKTLQVTVTSGTSVDVYTDDNAEAEASFTIKFYYIDSLGLSFGDIALNTYDAYNMNGVSGVSGGENTLNNYYYYRTGYTTKGWTIPTASGAVSGTTTTNLSTTSLVSFFASLFASDDGTDFAITISRNWQANTYYISYNGMYSGDDLYGTVSGSMGSTKVTYDQVTPLSTNNFTLLGYSFDGWKYLDGTDLTWATIITSLGTYTTVSDYIINSGLTGLFYYEGTYYVYNICTGETGDTSKTMYATWEAKTYTITVKLNGGTYDSGTNDITFSLVYNTTFDEIVSGSYTSLTDYIDGLQKTGFAYYGFYLSAGDTLSAMYKVENSTTFNSALTGFADDEDNALTLCVVWTYTGAIQMTVDDIITETYTGETITVDLADYSFTDTSTSANDSITITFDENNILSITADSTPVDITYDFTDVSMITENVSSVYSFTSNSKHVGMYYVTMNIYIMDTATYYNQGAVFTISLNLYLTITTASMYYENSADNSIYYSNVLYLVSLVETEEVVKTYTNLASFDNLISYTKTNDTTANSATDKEIYAYLIMKHYNMLTASVNTFDTFRAWTYEDYLTYYDNTAYFGDDENATGLAGDRATRQTVVSSVYYLSYDLENAEVSHTITNSDAGVTSSTYSTSQFILKSQTVANIANELLFYKIIAYSQATMFPGNTYEVRAYFRANGSADASISDYNYLSDSNGYYIVVGYAFMHVELVKLSFTASSTYTYYSSTADEVEVNYLSSSTATYTTVLGDVMYQYSGNLYIKMTLFTSNLGDPEVDTTYTFYDTTNTFVTKNGETFQAIWLSDDNSSYNYVTSYINVLLDEAFAYTILNVQGTSETSFDVQLLTKDDMDANTLTELTSALLSASSNNSKLYQIYSFTFSVDGVTSITYSVDGGLEDGEYYYDDGEVVLVNETSGNEAGGVLLITITGNNTNAPTMVTRDPISKVTFNITAQTLNTYTRLYDFTEEPSLSFYDDANSKLSHTLTFSASEETLKDIERHTYYLVYSDLIRVYYDYNLPIDGYDDVLTYLRVGTDTVDNIKELTVPYFELSRLLLKDATGFSSLDTDESGDVEVEELFTGTNGEYVGIYDNNIFADLELIAYWKIGSISMLDNAYSATYSVGTPVSIYATYAGHFTTAELNCFDYTYEILNEDGDVVATSSSFDSLCLNFASGGSIKDNGTYTVQVTAKIKTNYAYVLDDGSASSTSTSVNFTLTFMPYLVTAITYGGQTTVTYNGGDNFNAISFTIEYKQYETDDYGDATYTMYVTTSGDMFTLSYSNTSGTVTTLKDVDTYTISIDYDENYITLDGASITSATLTVEPYTMNLKDYNIYFSKTLNTADDVANGFFTTTYSLNGDSLTLYLTRESGEDIGTYDMYLASFDGVTLKNYVLVYGEEGSEVTLYSSEEVYSNLTTAVGVFEITSSGTLRIYWKETSGVTKTLTYTYSTEGYSFALTTDGEIIIYGDATEQSDTTKVATLTAVLYDVVAGTEITDSEILSALYSYFNDIALYGFDGSEPYEDGIYNAGTYSLYADTDASSGIYDYYATITFSTEYLFTIVAQTIVTSSLTFEKTYDGTSVIYAQTDGTKIDDIDKFNGVYIQATFATYHAGTNINVSLALLSTNSTEYLASNYALSSATVTGTIYKMTATITYSFTETSYTYGDLSTDNLTENVTYVVKDENSEDITEDTLFTSSTYSISYYLVDGTDNAPTNGSGYFYKGTYSLKDYSTFDDFNMTITTCDVTINEYVVAIDLSAGYFTYTVIDAIPQAGDLTELRTVTKTGDIVTVQYSIVDYTYPATVQAGTWDVALYVDTYENYSITFTINDDNSAFVIVATTNALYIAITTTSILTQTYSGESYTLSVDNYTLYVNNDDSTKSALEVYYYGGNGTKQEIVDPSSYLTGVEFKSGSLSAFTSVGSYKLSVSATLTGFSSLVLADNYYFTVEQKVINLGDITTINDTAFNKTYDGSLLGTLDLTTSNYSALLVSGEQVAITIVYAQSDAGNSIGITLSLSGTNAGNYTLSSTTSTASIEKASATLALATTSYTYGLITESTSLSFTVTDTAKGTTVFASQYTIDFEVEATSASYNTSGYLASGEYNVKINSISSTNYNITYGTLTLTITEYALDFVFTSNGYYYTSFGSTESLTTTFDRDYSTQYGDTITVTYTRSAGTNVGYYSITAGEVTDNNYVVSSVTDNSDKGAYRIIMSSDKLYILISSESSISDEDVSKYVYINIEYDGNAYDTAEFINDNGVYSIKISSTSSSANFSVTANIYTHADGTYTLADLKDSSIKSTLTLGATTSAQNVGLYAISANNTTCDNFDVMFGYSGMASLFLNITARELYFTTSTLSTVFTNSGVSLTYADASEVLSGVVSGDTLMLTVNFYAYSTGNDLAVSAGDGYRVSASLSGTNASNYAVYTTTANGTTVTGTIEKAPLILTVDSFTIIYGNTYTLDDFSYSSETIDLSTYYGSITITLSVASGATYSSTSNLAVGNWGIDYDISANDFYIASFICDGSPSATLCAAVNVTERTISVVQAYDGLPLTSVFQKTYDGTTTVDVTKNFGLYNVIELTAEVYDDVSVESGEYAQSEVGDPISITFTLTGKDAANYTISNYAYGSIVAISVAITFDPQKVSDYTYSATDIITAVSYPFAYTTYLTANSVDADKSTTEYFPTTMTDTTGGSTFLYWSLNFTATENSTEYDYITKLANSLGLTNSYETGVVKVVVGNNSATVALLDELLGDTNDYFGYYYAQHSDITFTFTANWSGNSYYFTVQLQDNDGARYFDNSAFSVTVAGTAMSTSSHSIEVEHGDTVNIVVTFTNTNLKVYGFYENNSELSYTANSGYTEYTYSVTVTSAHSIIIKIDYKTVTVTIDAEKYSGVSLTNTSSTNFEETTSGVYVWETTYEEIASLTLADLPELILSGFSTTEYEVNGGDAVASSAFATTSLADITASNEDDYVISLVATMAGLTITVTLDYNYDGKTEDIQVSYQSAFKSSTGWVETPEREGYEFLGWYLDADIVTGDTICTSQTAITLVASWTATEQTITLTLGNNLTLSSSDWDYDNGIYSRTVTFGEDFSLTLSVSAGYEIMSTSYKLNASENPDAEDVSIDTYNGQEGTVNMTFSALGNMDFTILATEKTISVSFDITYVQSITACDEDENEIAVTDAGTLSITTGKTLIVTLTMTTGYTLTSANVVGQSISPSVTEADGAYMLTFSGFTDNFSVEIEASPKDNLVTIDVDETFVKELIVGSKITTEFTLSVTTGSILEFYILFTGGYQIKDVTSDYDDSALTVELVITGAYSGYYHITVDGINKDGTISIAIKYDTYSIKLVTITYDSNGTLQYGTGNTAIFGEVIEDIGTYDTLFDYLSGESFAEGYYVYEKTSYYYDRCVASSVIVQVTDLGSHSTLYEYVSGEGLENGFYTYDDTTYYYNGIALISLAKNITKFEYSSSITLVAYADTEYAFAGWSLDNSVIFGYDNPSAYTVTSAVTIYAVFSAFKFNISFVVYDNYEIYTEYNDASKTKTVYQEIFNSHFYDTETLENSISSYSLYYGTSANIYVSVPTGYSFAGYGYQTTSGLGDVEYNYLSEEVSQDTAVSLYLSSSYFDATNANVTIFVALTSKEATVNVTSWLDYDGIYEADSAVSVISLVGEDGSAVNEYGYVDGTRTAYTSSSFTYGTGLSDAHNFGVSTYTANYVYIKVKATLSGYYFSNMEVDNNMATVSYYSTISEGDETYYIYRVYNIVGGSGDVEVHVYYKPTKQIVTYDFVGASEAEVDGGSFFLEYDSADASRVWGSGNNYSTLKVTSYTGISYTIVAYVSLGFTIDESDIQLVYDNTLVSISSVTAQQIDYVSTGYTYMITFNVADCDESTTVSIKLTPRTYTVLLRDETLTNSLIAEIRNVTYSELIDLSADNESNVTIYNDDIIFTTTALYLVQSRDNYNFGGYFSYQNGNGVQYINSTGKASEVFAENGYIFDEKTRQYVLSDNATIDSEGNITISLYLYWSYMKTQITFEIIPDVSVGFTAEDIVSGVDATNSWFNSNSSMYIEIAFNTTVNFNAPTISGYKFYKFVISQRTAQGEWLTDATSYTSSTPWGTNEYENIVECVVQIIYFAKVDVQLLGGSMGYTITQDYDDTVARDLISEGYVDTTKSFTISADASTSGYEFLYWQNATTAEKHTSHTFTDTISQRTIYILAVSGKSVTLLFDEYDATNGQIIAMQITSPTGSVNFVSLGSYASDGSFTKVRSYTVNVGDIISFVVSVDFGYGITWNYKTITLSDMQTDYYYFNMEILEDYADQSLQIVPTFSADTLALYVNQTFADSEILEDASDGNNASYAGSVNYDGASVTLITLSTSSTLTFTISVKTHYYVYALHITSIGGLDYDIFDYYDSETGEVTLTTEYFDENNIGGTLQLNVEYGRLYYTSADIEEVGDGTHDNPYEISSVEELAYYMQKINSGALNSYGISYSICSYIVTADFTLTEKFWTPIGTTENPFNGTFNFNGHTILMSGITLATYYSVTSYSGLFGVLGNNAEIILQNTEYWYIFVIVAIFILLIILLVILIHQNRKRKKKMKELHSR